LDVVAKRKILTTPAENRTLVAQLVAKLVYGMTPANCLMTNIVIGYELVA
jgi:hypothetical protein